MLLDKFISWQHLWWMVPVAFILDLIVGDPHWLPHPVVWIGKFIEKTENLLRSIFSHRHLRIAGILLWLIVTGGTFTVTLAVLYLAGQVSPWLKAAIEVYLLSTAFAAKGLAKAAFAVQKKLAAKRLEEARNEVAYIVGRDTQDLQEPEIVRATVETVAENSSDGIIAPLFFAFMGGAPLAYLYKAVNTLDSMVGYKNEKYLQFGWASARLDDIFNYVPARISALFLLLSSMLQGFDWRQAMRIMLRDAKKHPSPNGGYPEAVIAGALNIRLGGLNSYGGIASFRAFLGEPLKPLKAAHIRQTVNIMMLAALFFVLIGAIIIWLFLGS